MIWCPVFLNFFLLFALLLCRSLTRTTFLRWRWRLLLPVFIFVRLFLFFLLQCVTEQLEKRRQFNIKKVSKTYLVMQIYGMTRGNYLITYSFLFLIFQHFAVVMKVVFTCDWVANRFVTGIFVIDFLLDLGPSLMTIDVMFAQEFEKVFADLWSYRYERKREKGKRGTR